MQTAIYNIGLAGLLIGIAGCQQRDANPLIQSANQSNVLTISKPQLTKKVSVSIQDLKKIYSSDVSVSFPIEPESKPEVIVYWNGYGFISKENSGREFWHYSNDLAFEKQTARFVLKKQVEIIDANNAAYSNKISTSQNVTVKRGIPAVF